MTVDTFTIDADDNDYRVQGLVSVSYPPAYTSADSGSLTCQNNLAVTYSIRQLLLRWDTSSLPDNAIISGAILRAYIESKVDTDARGVVGDWHAWTPPPGSGDYSTNAPNDAFTAVLLSAITTSATNDFTLLNPNTNISKTGFTGLRISINGGEPAGANSFIMRNFPDSTPPFPQLIVTYTVPALGGISNTRLQMGVGF